MSRKNMLLFSPIWLLVFLVALTGCSGGVGDRPDIGRVSGVVTLDGNPVSGAQVTFQPVAGRPSAGETDASGKYVLLYSEGVEGAKVGACTVRISKEDQKFDKDGELLSSKETLPAKYNLETELTETVQAGDNTIDFTLTSS